MAEVKQKVADLDASQTELTKFKALHQELQKEVQMLTGEFGPDKLREEFQGKHLLSLFLRKIEQEIEKKIKKEI